MKNAGILPMKNTRELDRVTIAAMYGWTVREIYDAAQAFKQLHRRCPDSGITFREYLDLMKGQGLRPDRIDQSTGGYHLARYGDAGSYSIGNCRFVPGIQNQRERREGYQRKPAFRRIMAAIARRRQRVECPACGGHYSPGMLARWHGARCKKSPMGVAA